MRARSESYSCPLCEDVAFACQKLLSDHFYAAHSGEKLSRPVADLCNVRTCRRCKRVLEPEAACTACARAAPFGSQLEVPCHRSSASSDQSGPSGDRASPAAKYPVSVPAPALPASSPVQRIAEPSIAVPSIPGTGVGAAVLEGNRLAQPPCAPVASGPSPTLDEVGRGHTPVTLPL